MRKLAIAESQINNNKKYIPVTINDIVYSSIRTASKKLNVSEQVIYYWIKTDRAVKHINFKSTRCSCTICRKEISVKSLIFHYRNH